MSNNNNLSSSTRALLDAAKQDGPSRERRAAMWTGVTGGLVTHTPPQIKPQGASASGANGAAQAGAVKGAFWAGASMKGAFIGALFGSAISIGVATFMLRAKTETVVATPPPAQLLTGASQGNAASANATTNAQTQNALPTSNPTTSIELPATNDTNAQSTENSAGSSRSDTASDTSHASTTTKSGAHASHAAKKDQPPPTPEEAESMLQREVALVGEARRELLTGDPAAALKSVRTARALEARQMEPDEMGLEVKALRALGRDTEADRVESQLRTMYPGH